MSTQYTMMMMMMMVMMMMVMVMNQEVMMDHALRTISFIADIGDVLVVMVRRCPPVTSDTFTRHVQTKICCHVFETDDVCT